MAPRRCLGATLLWVCGSVASTAAQTYPIDGSALGVALNSVGAQSTAGTARLLYDYPEKQRAEILDLLFKPSYGASFQHLKVESELARSGLAMPLPVAVP
jgi:galactosylceramidase